MKGYKVASYDLAQRYGICANNLEELVRKGCQKLQIKNAETVQVLLLDGTEVEDSGYFQTLPPQTMFILAEAGKVPLAGSFFLYDCMRKVHGRYARAARQVQEDLLSNPKIINELSSAVVFLENGQRCLTSSRKEDPCWFRGLETNAQTKESFLSQRAKCRIRNYYWKTKEQTVAEAKDQEQRKKMELVFKNFQEKLKEVDYNGSYFDRSTGQSKRLCNRVGDFRCQGRWDSDNEKLCKYDSKNLEDYNSDESCHILNPYASMERRILFSTWNLDHVIERSRTVIPALVRALAESKGRTVDVAYFFDLLFTRVNLRLVHPVCHDKKQHFDKQCDIQKFYTDRRKRPLNA